jgi:hypothetical protein
MVKLELGLPWKPVLAWPWGKAGTWRRCLFLVIFPHCILFAPHNLGVEYKIDEESFLITEHKETWDIAPIEVGQEYNAAI